MYLVAERHQGYSRRLKLRSYRGFFTLPEAIDYVNAKTYGDWNIYKLSSKEDEDCKHVPIAELRAFGIVE